MKSSEIRRRYLEFFAKRGHAVIPSASLIPENDPTVLFTTAGMHPLVPYLLGEPHPAGQRLTDVQKCIRTGDIDEVGDASHLTFFEMLGNWSLGDYFKAEALAWTFEFLTSAEEGMGLPADRLYVTVFEGDATAPRDEEAISIWRDIFAKHGIEAKVGERIHAYDRKENWWGPAGQTGPCGPDSEIFYDRLGDEDLTKHWNDGPHEGQCGPACGCGRYLEIGNNVFLQYQKTTDGQFEPLAQRCVDFGGGFERLVMLMQEAGSVFETDLFRPIIDRLEEISGRKYADVHDVDLWAMRIIADHVRAACFILADEHGVVPSNKDQGYIVRRLIRRAVRWGHGIGIGEHFMSRVAESVIEANGEAYPELVSRRQFVLDELETEERQFKKTLERGLKELHALRIGSEGSSGLYHFSGKDAFHLYETYGFPKEMTEEGTGLKVDQAEWDTEMKKHQEMSRVGAEQKFSGGLADNSEEVVRLHTATHLLHRALRQVLGDYVEQKGSNITKDRLRFDFTHGEKMTDGQKSEVERIVNEQINADLPVHFEMMTVEEAKAAGAIGLFEDKYATLGNKVKVYFVGSPEAGYFSTEICGGPHVERTGELGGFRIKKEESSSAGIRRIKATVG